MTLKYKMPKVLDAISESELISYAESEGYEIKRIGNNENGELLWVLSEAAMPVGMSFLLTNKGSVESFTRVY
jgi:hypothetical protein